MRITPSRRADYALQAMICLAGSGSTRTAAPEIARETGLSVNYLRQVLRTLTRARLVVSSPSPSGGYALARPAQDISVLEIIEAIEGPLAPGECILRGGPCHWRDACPMHTLWSTAVRDLAGRLAGGSLASVAAIDRAMARQEYEAPADAHRRRAARP